MTLAEYRSDFYYFLRDTDQLWRNPFYKSNKNFRNILIELRYYINSSQKLQGFSLEDLIVLLYKSNILKEPLDKTFTKLAVGDPVITGIGMLGTVFECLPSGRVKVRVKGTNEIKNMKSSILVKVTPEVELVL